MSVRSNAKLIMRKEREKEDENERSVSVSGSVSQLTNPVMGRNMNTRKA